MATPMPLPVGLVAVALDRRVEDVADRLPGELRGGDIVRLQRGELVEARVAAHVVVGREAVPLQPQVPVK